MNINKHSLKRFKLTLNFVDKCISKKDRILDLGVENNLSNLIKSNGYFVTNTKGEDLDLDLSSS